MSEPRMMPDDHLLMSMLWRRFAISLSEGQVRELEGGALTGAPSRGGPLVKADYFDGRNWEDAISSARWRR